MKFNIEKIQPHPLKREIVELLESYGEKLPTLASLWLCDERKLEIASGWDDQDPSQKRVYLIFSVNGQEIAEAYVSDREVRALYPDIERLIPPEIRVQSLEEQFREEHFQAEDEYFERRKTLLPCEWNESLGFETVAIEDAIKIAVAYALTPNGITELYLSEVDQELLDDEPIRNTPPDSVLMIHAEQQSHSSGMSKVEFLYALPQKEEGALQTLRSSEFGEM